MTHNALLIMTIVSVLKIILKIKSFNFFLEDFYSPINKPLLGNTTYTSMPYPVIIFYLLFFNKKN